MLSITSDYARSEGCPEPCLRRIAETGFTHVHWCHQWNTDFLYDACEIEQIAAWLGEYGLALCDLHGSEGVEKCWHSPREYERQAGVELVRNRIAMVARLGSDVVIMHIGSEPIRGEERSRYWEQLWRSLDAIEPFARKHGVRIAIENGIFPQLRKVLERYPPDYVGLCYDSGHGNVSKDGLDEVEALKDRLISMHLHDNDGTGDQHKLLFTGTVDWPRLARTVATSAYGKCVSMEVSMKNSGIEDEEPFLAKAFDGGTAFAAMVAEAKTTP